MEIRLRGPRGRRHVINTGWEALKERLCSQGNATKAQSGEGWVGAGSGGNQRTSLPSAAEILNV